MDGNFEMLVIDDNKDFVELIKNFLKIRGFKIKAAYTAEQALKYLEEGYRPDMILLDLMLPGIKGMDFLETIKSLYPDLPVIVVSGIKDLNVAVEAMKKGASDYLTKPFGLDELEHRIHEAICRRMVINQTENFTADEALKTMSQISNNATSFRFVFQDITELNKFIDGIKNRSDVRVGDIRIGDEYEIYLVRRKDGKSEG